MECNGSGGGRSDNVSGEVRTINGSNDFLKDYCIVPYLFFLARSTASTSRLIEKIANSITQ